MTKKDHESLLKLIKAGRGHLAMAGIPFAPGGNYFCIGPIDAPVLYLPCGSGLIPKVDAKARKIISEQLAMVQP